MIRLIDAEKVYDNGTRALKGVSFTVDDGEFVFLVGPSGSGKSTIIKLMTGEVVPTAGRVMVNGFSMSRIAEKQIPYMRRTIGVIFQDFRLIGNKTVRDNLALAMRAVGASPRELKNRIPYVLELVGLADKENSYPDQLSGGEQQRVAIARALVNNPSTIVADEPTGNLDPGRSLEIMTLLEKILYLADYIEPSRDFPGVDKLRAVCYKNLDAGLLMGLEMTIGEMNAMGNPVHHATIEARDALKG